MKYLGYDSRQEMIVSLVTLTVGLIVGLWLYITINTSFDHLQAVLMSGR